MLPGGAGIRLLFDLASGGAKRVPDIVGGSLIGRRPDGSRADFNTQFLDMAHSCGLNVKHTRPFWFCWSLGSATFRGGCGFPMASARSNAPVPAFARLPGGPPTG